MCTADPRTHTGLIPRPARPYFPGPALSGLSGFHRRFGGHGRLRLPQREMTGGDVPAAVKGRSGGSSSAHSASASGHRKRNRQPDGGSRLDGSSPATPCCRVARSSLGQ